MYLQWEKKMIALNEKWEFTEKWTEEFGNGIGEGEIVRIPHNPKQIPLHNATPECYEGISGYRRSLHFGNEYEDSRIFLKFDGAAHIAQVYVNGKKVAEHRCGYTAFEVEITDHVIFNEDNMISVRLDSTENPAIPPFGFVIDYLTYGGLYRDVWLDIRPQSYIRDIYVTTPDLNTADIQYSLDGAADNLFVTASVFDGETVLCEKRIPASSGYVSFRNLNVRPWSCTSPRLYSVQLRLEDACGNVTCENKETFGFRTAEFQKDGFYLNGEKTFLTGLNRHQSYPYIGYAAPERLQREDARILRNELGCNAVRTSHYPQSQYFIDECDRIGLLVFTEIPGWQHIGNEEWKNQAVENTREMVIQYRNHPSIILWGVRINESRDDDALYTRTNAVAKELDPSRATSGVRYLEKSSLLEDVYAFNDFSHDGSTPGCRKKTDITPDMEKAFLISEANGHMYPTKSYDSQTRRQEHAIRHAKVLDAAMADGEHVGCFEWCMFDYPTHKDFGSGDRVCYHGVLDAFRNSKLAASVYASQSDEQPYIDVSSSMDIGDYPAGKLLYPYVFTNAEKVELYKNDAFVKEFYPTKEWQGLKHPPILIDDFIGNLVASQENYDAKKSDYIYQCLRTMEREGFSTLSLTGKLKLAWAMLRYRMTFDEGYRLYGKYIGNWGGEATRWRFDAVKGDKTVASVTRMPSDNLILEAKAGSLCLSEKSSYDMTLIRVRITDVCGNTAAYAQLPVRFIVSGCLQLQGPEVSVAEGGMTGCLVRTTGEKGEAILEISSGNLEAATLHFVVE